MVEAEPRGRLTLYRLVPAGPPGAARHLADLAARAHAHADTFPGPLLRDDQTVPPTPRPRSSAGCPAWTGSCRSGSALAMVAGLLLGRLSRAWTAPWTRSRSAAISLPIALGLLMMMYPVLAKVRYDRLDTVTGDRRLLISSLVLNWLVGPALMFALAWIFLPDLPEYRTGLIIVGPGPLHRHGASSGTTWPAATARPPPSWSRSTRSSRSSPSAPLGWFYLAGAARLARPADDRRWTSPPGTSPATC